MKAWQIYKLVYNAQASPKKKTIICTANKRKVKAKDKEKNKLVKQYSTPKTSTSQVVIF